MFIASFARESARSYLDIRYLLATWNAWLFCSHPEGFPVAFFPWVINACFKGGCEEVLSFVHQHTSSALVFYT
jgi:hypothetical protein